VTAGTIAFLGDVYLGQAPDVALGPEVLSLLREADLVVANQEGPITDRQEHIAGKCCLRSSPAAAQRLADWGVDAVTVANNHVFDAGWEGFQDTCRALRRAGIRWLGAGHNLQEATQPLVLPVGDLKVGLLAYSSEFVETTCAGPDRFGCAPLEAGLMMRTIRSLKPQVDAVVVLPHWGYCRYTLPAPHQVTLAHQLVEAGANAVVGHHSHVTQAVVISGGSLIAYSLGNFAFADFVDRGQQVKSTEPERRGLVLTASFTPQGVRQWAAYQTRLADGRVVIEPSDGQHRRFAQQCAALTVADYPRRYRRYVRRRMLRRLLYWANVLNWRKLRIGTLKGGWLMLKGILQGHRTGENSE